ncbi:hypothetical protein ILUMI_25031 [Ignelater luminosus]|uniref:Uncharacterized protein n=1 Tax=Ignelater luminosus TaxID=2038154 RepID=A0A8K0C5B5_IGNLU|nr:hypothetical protein ILUMI_25031 [Ignelater luminosus]
MNVSHPEMTPEIRAYYNALKARNELTRSDVSIFPSFTDLILPYRVICRQRYHLAGVKQRRQFLKEISVQEALQTRALSGVRVHREFCNPIINPPVPEEIVTLTREERRHLESVLVRKY